jgi:ribosome maturation factor RimP
MVEIEKIKETVEQQIAESDKFIVEINVSADNKITVIIDSDANGIAINDCVSISRAIETVLNRDEEDFELQVESAGLDRPLKMLRQFQKNINNDIDIVFTSGKKLTAKLVAAADNSIDIEYSEKALLENKKRKQLITKSETVMLADIKSVKVAVSFK